MKKRTFTKLNPQRRKLLEELSKGKTIGQAGIAAGYSYPQAANTAIKQMRPLVIAALEKRGWGIDEFVEKGMIPMLEAKKTVFFQNSGIVTAERQCIDNGARISANDQYLKIIGAYAPLNIEHSGAVIHVLTPAEKLEAENAVKALLKYDSEVIDIEEG